MKKTRIFLLLILAIYFLTFKSYAQTKIYEGWLYNSNSFKIDDTLYKIYIEEKGKGILLFSDKKTFSVNLNSCEEIDTKVLCYNISSYDSSLKDYKAFITLIEYQPKIEISRKITKNILSFGETALFTVEIKNTGLTDTEIYYEDQLPENIKIKDVDNCYISNNSIYYKGKLNSNEKLKIQYEIEVVGEVDKYTKAKLIYYESGNKKELFTETIRLYSEPILKIDLIKDKEDYQLDEEMNFSLSLTNKGNSEIRLNFSLNFPNSVELITDSYKNYDTNDNNLLSETKSLSLKLEPNETRKINYKIKNKKTGLFFITLEGFYLYKSRNYKLSNQKLGYVVHNEGIEISTSIKDPDYVYSNQNYLLYVKVKNKNSFAKIKNAKLNIISNLINFDTFELKQINPNETAFLINKEIKIPFVENQETYKLKFNLTYKTDEDEFFSEIFEKTIIVKPIEQLTLKINMPYTAYEENEIEVRVDIKNPGNSLIKDGFIEAIIPSDFKIIGVSSTNFIINKSQELNILNFKIIPNLVESEKIYNITFVLKYSDQNIPYKIEETKQIKVAQKVPEFYIMKYATTKPSVGEIIDVEYNIENKDQSIYDINIIPSENQYIDIVNKFETKINALNPNEKIKLKGEQIILKKSGNFDVGQSLVIYRDSKGRIFNLTSSSMILNVENNSNINSPLIIISKTISPKKDKYSYDDEIEIIINLTNLGTKGAKVNLTDEYINQEIVVPFYSSKTISKKIKLNQTGKIKFPQTKIIYEYNHNIIKSFSNNLEIYVDNNSNELNENTHLSEKNNRETYKNESLQEIESVNKSKNETKNIIIKIFNWFKSLFKR
ncbi:MAG: hypothetical protein QXE31_02440 [Candidatus Woesearchaeota archaeon]